MNVFVLDCHKVPLGLISENEASYLLWTGQARILRQFPFVIILHSAVSVEVKYTKVTLRIDPGSKTTGVALVDAQTNTVVWAMELEHRGEKIKQALESRASFRRGRRSRKTPYRRRGALDREKPEGWFPPSVLHRVQTTMTWVRRLQKFTPLVDLAFERVKFDTQLLANPNVAGVAYQQGTLFGYEVREYLLERDSHTCQYCGVEDAILEIEHILAKTNGGTDRVGNLVIACRKCNEEKSSVLVERFVGDPRLLRRCKVNGSSTDPDVILKRIQSRASATTKDAAAVNMTRNRLASELSTLGLPVEISTGGRTKYNRSSLGYPKAHWIDAACVGEGGLTVALDPTMDILHVTAKGHGSRQMMSNQEPVKKDPETGKPVANPKTGNSASGGFPVDNRKKVEIHKAKTMELLPIYTALYPDDSQLAYVKAQKAASISIHRAQTEETKTARKARAEAQEAGKPLPPMPRRRGHRNPNGENPFSTGDQVHYVGDDLRIPRIAIRVKAAKAAGTVKVDFSGMEQARLLSQYEVEKAQQTAQGSKKLIKRPELTVSRNFKQFRLVQEADGYAYSVGPTVYQSEEEGAESKPTISQLNMVKRILDADSLLTAPVLGTKAVASEWIQENMHVLQSLPATTKQLRYIKSLTPEPVPENLSVQDASDLIGKLKTAKASGE